ncbi:EAL domain-containing protein [Cytobacillus solani]|uniref:EAL domain-containing protein n=1 Tax=Cytobacillus solani TaxID=1637975 RepID=UPI0020795D42|nr:EAL domain-containing protein [Cytobacillus solani]USK54444.1 EAL domain-containing protein [Cytobacillus solani]
MSIDMLARIENQSIESVYQPMWNLNHWKVFGYEALLRFPNGFCNGNIEKAFELARENGCLYELDTKAIRHAISCFPIDRLKEELLFINIYPSTILHKNFENFIHQLQKNFPHIEEKVVFELSETDKEDSIWDLSEFKEKIAIIKEYGFRIAIDDIGKGGASLRKIIEFSPQFIKLDRYFANNLDKSKEKQQMVALLLQYSKQKMELILEGVEKNKDLAQAIALNIPFAQGYLLGKPETI